MVEFTDPDLQGLDYWDLEPYTWYGTVLFQGFIRRHHVSIAPDDATDFHIRVQWADRGAHDLMQEYRVTSEHDRLQVTLHKTDFHCQCSFTAGLEERLWGNSAMNPGSSVACHGHPSGHLGGTAPAQDRRTP